MTRETGRPQRTTLPGEAVTGQALQAFVPHPLPPADPTFELDADLSARLRDAEVALRQLDLATAMVPSTDWFLYAFVRKEAVVSSQIEGTQSTLVDLLQREVDYSTQDLASDPDLQEVCNYLEALAHAREQLRDPHGLPLSIRLLNDTHAVLMRGVRGADKQPGRIRQSQNWIGGARPSEAVFVPPPPELLDRLLADFERYLHAEDELPALIRIGLLHAQFETLHPYLDGNGRMGRLLITLLLEQYGLLTQPLCYLSLFLKRNRSQYYDRLSAIRERGDWEGWIRFFLRGAAEIAIEATHTARALFALVSDDRKRVLAAQTSTLAAARLFESLPTHPIVTIATAARRLDTTRPTADKAVKTLVQCGVLAEGAARGRERTFSYVAYLDLLREGTEPL